MKFRGQITYISRNEIDTARWDKCVETASNGLIYGYSYYLDAMARNWEGLVLNDYEAVMPLTWNKKYGIKYLYQPFLAAQLGIFGNDLDAFIVNSFLETVPVEFRYWDIYLNHHNLFELEKFKLYQRVNFLLPLDKPYEQLFAGYRENIRRNCKKCFQLGCKSEKNIDIERIIDLAWQQMRSHSRISWENAKRFRTLFTLLSGQNKAVTYGILSARNELLASCVFFYSNNRAYYILVGNHPNGRTIGASHALIDAFIQDHAGQQLILDFEGSDIRNLAFFYSSFGAVEEKYAAIRLNRLPFYLKWLKK